MVLPQLQGLCATASVGQGPGYLHVAPSIMKPSSNGSIPPEAYKPFLSTVMVEKVQSSFEGRWQGPWLRSLIPQAG